MGWLVVQVKVCWFQPLGYVKLLKFKWFDTSNLPITNTKHKIKFKSVPFGEI